MGLLAASFLSAVSAFQPSTFVGVRNNNGNLTMKKTPLKMALEPTFDTLFSKVTEKFGLQVTDFAETFDGQNWQCPKTGNSGTADWYSESSPQYLTGVSKSTVWTSGIGDSYTINIWMGPSYDVPNLLLSFGDAPDGTFFVDADYVPRGADPLGSNVAYMDKYYGEDVTSAWDNSVGLTGAEFIPPSSGFHTRLLSSPARIHVKGLKRADDAAEVATAHVERFFGWINDAQTVPARLRGSYNMRDDKLRQFFYRGEMVKNIDLYGDELGSMIAAVNTGPVAEAYVGGGS